MMFYEIRFLDAFCLATEGIEHPARPQAATKSETPNSKSEMAQAMPYGTNSNHQSSNPKTSQAATSYH
jgi:hypothetical protein